MRHLGDRVAPLVDGRMTPAEEERAWSHVHGCVLCSDAVQREGWIKQQLAGLSSGAAEPLPAELRGSLCDTGSFAAYPGVPTGSYDAPGPRRRLAGLALGAGSVSAAVVGVVALGVAPANAPGLDRRAPASITQPSSSTTPGSRSSLLRTDLSRLDPGSAARQVATTVGAGMRMGW